MANESAEALASEPINSPALYSTAAWLRFVLVGIAGVAADLSSKHSAFKTLGYGRHTRQVVLVPHVLKLETTLNGGAVFGVGQGLSLVFVIVSLVALGFVAYVFMTSYRRQWVLHIALGLIMAGAIGNLYDRVFNHGLVRDFIRLAYWPWIFNIADAMLCVGVPLLILSWLKSPQANRGK